MTARYVTDTHAALAATRRLDADDREHADLLRWLAGRCVLFIELAGGGIDVSNSGGGLIAALRQARHDARLQLPPSAVAIGAGLDGESIEQGDPT